MDCDCDICHEQSWWDWLEGEPGLGLTVGFWVLVITLSLALYLFFS